MKRLVTLFICFFMIFQLSAGVFASRVEDEKGTKLGRVKFDVEFNYNEVELFDKLGFSGSLSYDFDEDYDFDENHDDFETDEDCCVRNFCAELDNDYVLDDEGDCFSIELGVLNLSEERASNILKTRFEYTINKRQYGDEDDEDCVEEPYVRYKVE